MSRRFDIRDHHRKVRDVLRGHAELGVDTLSYATLMTECDIWTLDATRGAVADLSDWAMIRTKPTVNGSFTFAVRKGWELPDEKSAEIQPSTPVRSMRTFDCGHAATAANTRKTPKGPSCKQCWKDNLPTNRRTNVPTDSVDAPQDVEPAPEVIAAPEPVDATPAPAPVGPAISVPQVADVVMMRLPKWAQDLLLVEAIKRNLPTVADLCEQLIEQGIAEASHDGTKPHLRGAIMRAWRASGTTQTYGEFATGLIELGLCAHLETEESENAE